MIKLIKILGAGCLLGLLIWLLLNNRFYSKDQLNDARIAAVELAKQGDIATSLERLDVLTNYEKDNVLLWADYLTVLEWDKQFEKVSDLAIKLDVSQSPKYLVESLITSVEGLYRAEKAHKARALYQKLLISNNQSFDSNSEKRLRQVVKHYDGIWLAKKSNNTNESGSTTYGAQYNNFHNPNLKFLSYYEPNRYFEGIDGSDIAGADVGGAVVEKYQDDFASEPKTKEQYRRWTDSAAVQYPDKEKKLAFYQQSHSQFPKNIFITTDYLTLLSWNDQHDNAWQLFLNNQDYLQLNKMPVYALEALGLSTRSVGEHLKAKQIYQLLLQKNPASRDARLGLASAEIELGNKSKAEKILRPLLKDYPSDPDVLALMAYAYNQSGSTQLQKLELYQTLQKIGIDKRLYEAAYLTDMAKIGLYDEALLRINEDNLFSTDQKVRVYQLANTFEVRAAINQMDEYFKFEPVHNALKLNKNYIDLVKGINANNYNETDLDRLSFAYSDRLLLLARLLRDDDVIALYEDLNNKEFDIQQYAHLVVAEAYLNKQNSNQSLAVIKDGIAKSDSKIQNYDLYLTGYFAAKDAHQYDLAREYLRELDASQPAWRYSESGARRKPNAAREDVELLLAMDNFYQGDYDKAEAMLETLVAKAPNNTGYRVNLAQLYRARGWYEKSYKQLSLAQALEPDNTATKILSLYNAFGLNENQLAAQYMDELSAEPYQSNQIKLVKTDWDIHDDALLTASVSTADNDGSNFSSKDFSYSLDYQTQPLNDFWRLHFNHLTNEAEYFNQVHSVDSNSLGLSYQRNWGGIFFGLTDVESYDKTSYYLAGQWRYSDYLFFDARYDSFSKNLPVRAFASNVFADELSLSARYRVNEKYSYGLSYSILDFSDGNKRQSFNLNAEQQVYLDPWHEVRLFQSMNLSKNKQISSANYFNPSQSSSVNLGAQYSGVLSHYHNRWWRHQVRANLGLVKQENFGSDFIWDLSYQHRLQFNKRFSAYLSVGYGERFYDGQKESGPFAFAGIEWRF